MALGPRVEGHITIEREKMPWDLLKEAIDGSIIKIYSGVPPADPSQITASQLLMEMKIRESVAQHQLDAARYMFEVEAYKAKVNLEMAKNNIVISSGLRRLIEDGAKAPG